MSFVLGYVREMIFRFGGKLSNVLLDFFHERVRRGCSRRDADGFCARKPFVLQIARGLNAMNFERSGERSTDFVRLFFHTTDG